jgi:hypothetical protein
MRFEVEDDIWRSARTSFAPFSENKVAIAPAIGSWTTLDCQLSYDSYLLTFAPLRLCVRFYLVY